MRTEGGIAWLLCLSALLVLVIFFCLFILSRDVWQTIVAGSAIVLGCIGLGVLMGILDSEL